MDIYYQAPVWKTGSSQVITLRSDLCKQLGIKKGSIVVYQFSEYANSNKRLEFNKRRLKAEVWVQGGASLVMTVDKEGLELYKTVIGKREDNSVKIRIRGVLE